VLLLSLVVVHDAQLGGQDDVTELTSREKVLSPLVNRGERNIEAGGDDTALVDTAKEVDNDLAAAQVINDLELTDVTVLLHDLEELDNDLRGGADKHLTLASALGVRDVHQGVVEDRDQYHFVS